MNYIYLFIATTFSAMITIGGRLYNTKTKGVTNVSMLYMMLVPSFAALGWLCLWCIDFSFDIRVLPYAMLYGVGYTLFTVGMLGALDCGSTSLTALVKQVALVGVSFWGFLFWDTALTITSGLGIALIIISLALCLLTNEAKNGKNNLLKWLLFALMVAVGNAGCSIVQRYQQMAFDYQHKNMFMFFGVLFSALVSVIISLREDRANWKSAVKASWLFPAITGLSSVLSNVFILLLVKKEFSPVILYPGVAVGGLMLTIIISLIGFREKIRTLQWLGLAVGAVALVLLNI